MGRDGDLSKAPLVVIVGTMAAFITIFIFVTGKQNLPDVLRAPTAPTAYVPPLPTSAPPASKGNPGEESGGGKYNAPNSVVEKATDVPRMYGFLVCLDPCTGSNARSSIPGGTKRIYLQWHYENIPVGASYTRTWTMNGERWVQYYCTWPGPSAGTDMVPLKEPGGLRSGTWQVTITVNGITVLQEQVQVQGNWQYWSPVAAPINNCYGTSN